MSNVSLNPHEVKVLAALVSVGSVDFNYLPFKSIAERSHLRRAVVRRCCRSLKRKGLAAFARGLWTEDGLPAGSGYGATRAGVERADQKLVEKIATRFWQ